MNRTIVYYTCNTHDPTIDEMCRAQLLCAGLPIVCVSLNKPLDYGDITITLQGERGPLMMHRQIVTGLEAAEDGIVYLCESDVLYHPSHFDESVNVIGYNVNVWRLRWGDGLAVWTDGLQQVSGLRAERDLLHEFYARRVNEIERDGFDRHYEPRGLGFVNWMSEYPNICIRHGQNLTKSKWSPDEFRNKRYAAGWRETHAIPGWYKDGSIWQITR
jgi:hypothetical protein